MKSTTPSFRINDEITHCESVRLIGDNFESTVVPFALAKEIARSKGLDLVEINSNVSPHIVKMCVYEKMLYEMKKAAKKNKSSSLPMKEIQISVNISKHDLEIKSKQARSFLNKGHKVKLTLTMKGRELSRRDDNKQVVLDFIVSLEDISLVESMKDDGNKTIVILKRKK